MALLGPKQRSAVGLLVAATLCSLSWLLMVPEPRGAPGLRPSKHCTTKALKFLTGAYLQFGGDELFALSTSPMPSPWGPLSETEHPQAKLAKDRELSQPPAAVISLAFSNLHAYLKTS